MAKHIWYSNGTDVTGRALGDALNLTSTREKPRLAAGDVLVGWGTKTEADVTIPAGVHILNHPNAIRANRNKFTALTLMKANRDLAGHVANFCKADQVERKIAANEMSYPLFGRKNFHQGGSGLWICLSKASLRGAIEDGAQYFQSCIDIVTEYRLHVFEGRIMYAVKKTENATEAGWVAQRKEKVEDYANKNHVQINAATLDYALKVIFKEQQLPDRAVRSNHRGWKFAQVAVNTLPASLVSVATNAVKAIGLDFGAVDCAIDSNSNAWIIEVNSGPGLEGTTLEKYTEVLRSKIAEFEAADAAAAAAARRAAAPAPARAAAARPVARRAAPRRGVVEEVAPARAPRARRAVGAAAADAPEINDAGMVRVIRNVQTDAEARAVIAALMRQ